MVRVASSQIHQLAGAALDPATPVTASDLKKALVEIHGGIAALQHLTGEACLSLQKKGTYPYNAESDSTHDGDSVDDLGGVSSIALCCSLCQCEQYMLYLFKYLYMSRVVYYKSTSSLSQGRNDVYLLVCCKNMLDMLHYMMA